MRAIGDLWERERARERERESDWRRSEPVSGGEGILWSALVGARPCANPPSVAVIDGRSTMYYIRYITRSTLASGPPVSSTSLQPEKLRRGYQSDGKMNSR